MPDRLDRELASILGPLGVEPENPTPTEEERQEPARPLVVSLYDKEDEAVWNSLQRHLNLLMRRYRHMNWITHRVENNGWIYAEEKEITKHINQARLIVIGLSVNFPLYEEGSYILTALEASRTKQRENTIWVDQIQPVILRPVLLQDLDIADCRSVAPSSYKSIIGAEQRDAACVEVVTVIENALKELVPQK